MAPPPMRRPQRWTNISQPQTLQIAVFLLYADAVILGVLFQAIFVPVGLVTVVALGVSGWAIANEKKWGYALALFLSLAEVISFLLPLPEALRFLQGFGLIGLMVAFAKAGLLLHPESRGYTRIWFK